MIRQLLWKEWSEQSWRFYFSTMMVVGFTAIGLSSPIMTDWYVIDFLFYIITIPLPWLICMGVLVPDRVNGVQPFLISLPIRPQAIFWVKSVLGLGNCLLPIAAAWILFLAVAGNRELSPSDISFFFFMIALNVFQNYTWTLILSIHTHKEARVGFIGIIIFASMFIYWCILLFVCSGVEELCGIRLYLHPLFPYHLLFFSTIWELDQFNSIVYQDRFWLFVFALLSHIVLSIGLLFWGSFVYAKEEPKKS